MRFYNQQFSEVMNMPNHWLEALYLAITSLEARESILSISNDSVQNMKQGDRKKRISELEKLAEYKKTKTHKTVGEMIAEAKAKSGNSTG